MTDRSDIEAQLLKNPFDHALRLTYANALLDDEEAGEALTQFQLVLGSEPENVKALIGSANCHLLLDNREDALKTYSSARGLEGFEPDQQLERLVESARTSRSHLKAVDNIPTADLIEFRSRDDDKLRFRDIVGMEDLKKTLRLQIIEPFVRPGLFNRFKKQAGGGVLLYSPPGCGKTMIARHRQRMRCRVHIRRDQ